MRLKMITKEVNDWLNKVQKGNYSSWDIMEEFTSICKHLTKAELTQIQKKLKDFEISRK